MPTASATTLGGGHPCWHDERAPRNLGGGTRHGLGALIGGQLATVAGMLIYLFVAEPLLSHISALHALAAYLAAESIHDLVTQARPEQSVPGLAVTATALLVMPSLAIAKRRTGQALGSRTLIADSAETAFCAFTSAAALIGLGLHAWLGWWWADPAAALVIAALAIKEGIEAWEHDG